MANPGAGAKFLSVNLNKSYGQSGHSSSSSNNYASGRGRGGGYSAGGGSGVVVLSRPRSSHKAAPKLSVPPPVNLPSLRKEHERFDPLGSASGSVAGVGAGNGPRPVLSGMGWSKPSAVTQADRDGISNARPQSSEGWDHRQQFVDGSTKTGVPPPANLGRVGSNLSILVQPEKTTVLRGEDFPSLSATISATSGPSHKQKTGLHNQKHGVTEESSSGHRDGSHLISDIDMRPRGHSSHSSATDVVSAVRSDSLVSGSARLSDQARRQDDHLPVPLPLVRLNLRSDWADDERDTSHAFSERGRDLGFSKMEPYWDKDFDFPRSSIVPHKPAQNITDRWTRRDDNMGYGVGARHQFHNSVESSNVRGSEWNTRERSRNGPPESNRLKAESVLTSSVSNPSSTSGSKGLSINDNFGRGKRTISRGGEKPSVEDWGNTSFDEPDPFSGNLLGIVKRKKDTSKQADFHDPVRESFEAELERVQKLQEQERQRIIIEQERALELVRKEEQERQRILREQEEHQRQLEEEAREAAWRAEQERQEVIRRAEEQKMAREEERRRLSMEEERRKQAAKQKLLELEQRIARRQAETADVDGSTAVVDERVSKVPAERDTSTVDELSSWEDSERAVERIRKPESSSHPKSFDAGSREHHLRDGPFALTDRGKSTSWRRDVFENGNSSSLFPPEQVNGHQSPRRDAFANGGRNFTNYGPNGYVSSRAYYGGGFPESQVDDFSHGRSRELDSDFHETGADRFNEMVSNQGYSRGNVHAPYADRVYQNSELDDLYSYGRPRYSSRQPRVLPPPMASIHRTSFSSDSQHAGTSAYGDRGTQYNHAVSIYDNVQREMPEDADIPDVEEESGKTQVQNLNRNSVIGCDSQSSLSVSSPPHSPAHLSHDDLDDTGDSLVVSGPAESNDIPLSGNNSVVRDMKPGKDKILTASSCLSTGDDDEWAIESNDELQEQKDYDEEEDVYHEEDEENERDNDKVGLVLEFEGINMDGNESSVMENLVLGFDQGVEVGIPNDEYERCPTNEESSYIVPQVPADQLFGDKQEDALSKQYGGAPSHTVDNCTVVVQEGQTTSHDMVTQTNSDSADHSSGSIMPAGQLVHSSAFKSTAASVSSQNQAEMQAKFQFGLFSGPSLIPSPIPAIQIGSIQMPLQLPQPVGPSLTHMHTAQSALFQFGQISYPALTSHGLLQLTPQPITSSQPHVRPTYPLNQNPGVSLSAQPSHDGFAHSFIKDYTFPLIVESQHHDPPKSSASQVVSSKEANLVEGSQSKESGQPESKGSHHQDAGTIIASTSAGQASEGQLHRGPSSLTRTAVHGQASGSRGRKVPFPGRTHSQRLPFSVGDAYHSHATGFQKRQRRGAQKMEFRVRQNPDKRQSSGSLAHQPTTDMKPNNNRRGFGTFTRSGMQRDTSLDRTRQTAESGSFSSDKGDSQVINLHVKADKANGKEAPHIGHETSDFVDLRLKRNLSSEEDVDAPLQSGIVRIFNQPGIEAASDEDDFIEVRSKRQMLNDRREQREREKAKSKNKKAMRKPRLTTQGTPVARTIVKPSASSSWEAPKSIPADATQNRGLVNQEVATGSSVVSQLLAPIGPPAVSPEAPAGSNSTSQMNKTAQISTVQAVSSSGQTVGSGLNFNSEQKHLDHIQGWDNAQINQEVMPLTQTQFDEAMKPGRVDMNSSSVEDHIKSVSEMGRSTSPITMKDTPFSSATSPIKSLLAGERIQFGAVTSPAVLPSNTRAVPHGIVSLGSEKIQFGAVTSPTVPPSSRSVPNGIGPHCSEKIQFGALPSATVLPSSSSAIPHEKHLEDCEAEAEAAASAIAVAAISNDEGVGNRSRTLPDSMSNANAFGSNHMDELAASGVAHDQPSGQSKAEEVLTVSLPADLSVETPPISLWPPLPSPHGSSSHMLSPFPGTTPSPYPFYDMNPMLGGPVYAFGPHEESVSSQSQAQKSSTSDSGHLGTWQPCHSGVDSFYGPPAGFPGPFMNHPPGSIPGVQAPPHMVVYNHFAPVGRFGQVGLSYMGTYISSTKQPDWKHNPTPPSNADGDIKNLNSVSSQHNPQAHNLAPGSALLPMPSPPVAMFDVSPFQSSGELPVQACWSHVPAPPSLQSLPHSMQLPQRTDDGMPPPLRLISTDNHSLRSNRFAKPPSPPLENVVEAITDATKPQAAKKFGLVDAQNSDGSPETMLIPNVVSGSTSRSDANKSNMQSTSSGLKVQGSEQNTGQRQHNHRPLYNYQRGGSSGSSHKNSAGIEWSGRRSGFHGRNQSGNNGGRGFPPTKMKQIYVAKQSSGGASTNA